ncbi:hypothetical protein LCGC14_0533250 [marine sediment metagenome]|uniref:Uncharacterized protein n=1 Tax=marine sediment metagenome TaxID=412755 RepID=A0A0F9UGD4_9ZZZZ
MNDKQLEALREAVSKRVHISCCENHAHSALDDCLSGGDERDITICKLIEVIRYERKVIREATKQIG